MHASDSTIVAIATPPGQGGVGIVRLSGPESRQIAESLFHPTQAGAGVRSHRMVHGVFRDPSTTVLLDEGLLCLMASPHSYTGEDVVEFHCHGSPAVLQRMLACCLAGGARLAQRGEFTLRAFLNGRLDLAQAEAVMNLVSARTATAAQVAAQGVTGALAHRLEPAIHSLTGALAYLEASIDFVEEDLPAQAAPQIARTIAGVRCDLDALLRRAAHGSLLRDGVRVVLAGKPNVGKSSLLNAILRRDRAIVTPIAGTTRDTLEEAADIHGLPMFLVDTAGLTDTEDPVERLGVARSRQALGAAGIVALVVDAGGPLDAGDRQAAIAVHAVAPRVPVILVLNKCDLPSTNPAAPFEGLFEPDQQPAAMVRCSALSGQGLDTLEDVLAALALGGEQLAAEDTLVENVRQQQALSDAALALRAAEEGLHEGRPAELVCIDLRGSLDALATITGENVGEAVLDRIFRDFCIGK